MIKFFQIVVLLISYTPVIGGGILGAHLECKPIPNTFNGYKVTLSLYVEGTSEELDEIGHEVYVAKNDTNWERDGRWRCYRSFEVLRVSSTKIQQNLLGCNATNKREIFLNIYEGNIGFGPIDEPFISDGCVFAWHSITNYRGKGDKNFVESSSLAEWVTTFMPPLIKDNGLSSTMESSPTIGRITDFTICKDELTEIEFLANKVDGDELKFRLSTPYAVSDVDFEGITLDIEAGNWIWASGYNEQNPINGDPSLSINENTGVLTVKPGEAGQYFFGVSIDKYRNGAKIGTLNFYYTLTVIDCKEQLILDKHLYTDTTAVTTLSLCEGSDATLTSKQTFPNPQPKFQWTKDGKVIWGETSQSITIHEPGSYQLLTTDINGCPDSFDSETVKVSVASGAEADIDSIPPICDLTAPPIAMHANPAGGTFAGPGVAGNAFDPRIAGVGRHEVEYVIQGTDACPGSTTKREITVGETPVLNVTEVLYTARGKPISIGTTDSLNVNYQWTPPDYLNNGNYANPTATPLPNITYTLTATSAFGCTATREVKIGIIEGLMIPDAFTPNNDGINETWELKGIAEYPQCEVTIYNRWGEVIFHSIGYQHAFDGTVKGAMQMPGVYAYKIRLNENSPELRGALTLLR